MNNDIKFAKQKDRNEFIKYARNTLQFKTKQIEKKLILSIEKNRQTYNARIDFNDKLTLFASRKLGLTIQDCILLNKKK